MNLGYLFKKKIQSKLGRVLLHLHKLLAPYGTANFTFEVPELPSLDKKIHQINRGTNTIWRQQKTGILLQTKNSETDTIIGIPWAKVTCTVKKGIFSYHSPKDANSFRLKNNYCVSETGRDDKGYTFSLVSEKQSILFSAESIKLRQEWMDVCVENGALTPRQVRVMDVTLTPQERVEDFEVTQLPQKK